MKLKKKGMKISYHTKTQTQRAEIKSKLVELLYWIFLIIMWFAILGTIFRTKNIGVRPINYVHIIFTGYYIIIFLLRKRFSHNIKSVLLLLNLLGLGTAGIFSLGLYSQGILLLLLLVLLSSTILDAIWGFISFGISFLVITISGVLFMNGTFTIDPMVVESAHHFSGWFMASLIFSLISIIVIIFWRQVLIFLIGKINTSYEQESRLEKINKLLKKEIETRKKTEYLRKKQNAKSKALNHKYEKTNKELQLAFHNLEKSKLMLTEAKKKAQSADRLKSSFLSNMSHEIRTPLNAIVGFSSLLNNNEISDKEYAHYLEVIQSSTHNLLNTITDIVDMAKIEAGQYTLHPELIELNRLIDEISDTLKQKYQTRDKKHILLTLDKELPTPCNVTADKQSLVQIISKLIDNAFKFTKKGEITLLFNLSPDGSFNITVNDTGIGIRPQQKTDIFNIFHQLEDDHNHGYGGIGLGLSIAKGLLNLLNGSITFQSETNKGSTFSVSIPLMVKNELINTEKSNKHWKGKTVLIIGKETLKNQTINQILQESQAIINFVDTSFEAIDTIKQHPEINVTLISTIQNDMNPEKFIKVVKQIRPLLPIIAYNSSQNPKHENTEIWDGYFYHPVDKNLLTRILENYLGNIELKAE